MLSVPNVQAKVLYAFCVVILVSGYIGSISVDAKATSVFVECRLKTDPLTDPLNVGASSFLIPGLGQFLNGEDTKGLVHLSVGLGLPTAAPIVAVLFGQVSPTMGAIVALEIFAPGGRFRQRKRSKQRKPTVARLI